MTGLPISTRGLVHVYRTEGHDVAALVRRPEASVCHVEGGEDLEEELTRGGGDPTDLLAGGVGEDLHQHEVVHLDHVEQADALDDGPASQVVAVGQRGFAALGQVALEGDPVVPSEVTEVAQVTHGDPWRPVADR